jgi:hypothetical protein
MMLNTNQLNNSKIPLTFQMSTLLPYHRKCTLLLQPPEQQEAMTNNFKYHSPEYKATKTHTSIQQSEHGITCQQC